MKIFKYKLDFTDEQTIYAKIIKPLSVQFQNKEVCLWAVVDEKEIQHKETIRIYGTGALIENVENMIYISTLQIGAFVFHYFIDKLTD